MLGRLRAFLGEPQSALGLGAFRALFGGLMLLSTLRFIGRGWVDALYVTPSFHFTYFGFEWLRPWPPAGVYLHFGLLALSALSLALGYRARLSALVFCGLFTCAELWEKASYLNHYYLVSLLAALLVAVPCGSALSLDSRRSAKDKALTQASGSAQASRAVRRADYWLLRAQLACVYGFAGIAKLNHDWLFRAEPVRGWLMHFADLPLVGGLLTRALTAFALSWLGALFDLCVVPLLCWRRTRRAAFALALVFHVSNWLMFPIGIFSWLMLISLTLFFDPAWPERLLSRARGEQCAPSGSQQICGDQHSAQGVESAPGLSYTQGAPSTPKDAIERPDGFGAKYASVSLDHGSAGAVVSGGGVSGRGVSGRWLGLAGGFLLLQLLLPLRGLLYPGELNWTEQGFRFAWRVMLVEKAGVVEFDVTTNRGSFRVFPRDSLTPLQLRMMATAPDMIHEYALHVAQRFRSERHSAVQVRARAFTSMNGRPSSPLIDPAVDLAALPRSLGPAEFVTLSPR